MVPHRTTTSVSWPPPLGASRLGRAPVLPPVSRRASSRQVYGDVEREEPRSSHLQSFIAITFAALSFCFEVTLVTMQAFVLFAIPLWVLVLIMLGELPHH